MVVFNDNRYSAKVVKNSCHVSLFLSHSGALQPLPHGLLEFSMSNSLSIERMNFTVPALPANLDECVESHGSINAIALATEELNVCAAT